MKTAQLEEEVQCLESRLKKVRGELILESPNYSIPRLQELGLSPQMAECADHIIRNPGSTIGELMGRLNLPSAGSFYSLISRLRRRLRLKGVTIQHDYRQGYFFDHAGITTLTHLMKGDFDG